MFGKNEAPLITFSYMRIMQKMINYPATSFDRRLVSTKREYPKSAHRLKLKKCKKEKNTQGVFE